MTSCVSFTAHRDRCYRCSFTSAGLRPSSTSLPDGTVVRCWAPRDPDPARPSLLLLHGFGANATWQWDPYLRPLIAAGFNVYIPDLLFFGGSFTPLPDRSESFQVFLPFDFFGRIYLPIELEVVIFIIKKKKLQS